MNKKIERVLLWNPLSNHGHLNMYLELYAESLIQLGYEVFYYADLDSAFEAYLQNELPKLKSVEEVVPTKRLRRWTFSWLIYVGRNLLLRAIKSALFRLKRMLFKNTKGHSFVEFDVLTRKLKILKDSDFVPDLVICMYLDMTRLTNLSKRELSKFKIPWIGLLFHPEPLVNATRFPRESGFENSSNVGGIFFTDKYLAMYHSLARPNQLFRVFPDVTKARPLPEIDLPRAFSDQVKGRPVVGLIGALDGHKKLIKEFLEISKHPLMSEFYFVLAGEVYESSLETDVLQEVRRLSGSIQENLYIYDNYIESELQYDSFVNAVDILFACYKDFDSSANILAKSAIFRKPVLVKSETWIGNLVESFNLGKAVSVLSIDNLLKAIISISKELNSSPSNFGFKDYEFHVSQENLRRQLGNYLEELSTKKEVL
jgi:hypothetical protein